MPNISPAVVFAHSAWHDASTWYVVAPLFAACHVVWANAQVTHQDRTCAMVDLIEELEPGQNSSILPVGHSLLGLTVTVVAEEVPNDSPLSCISRPSCCQAAWLRVIECPTMADALVPSLFPADPGDGGGDANRSTLGPGGLS